MDSNIEFVVRVNAAKQEITVEQTGAPSSALRKFRLVDDAFAHMRERIDRHGRQLAQRARSIEHLSEGIR